VVGVHEEILGEEALEHALFPWVTQDPHVWKGLLDSGFEALYGQDSLQGEGWEKG
jgi:hypothetical protein